MSKNKRCVPVTGTHLPQQSQLSDYPFLNIKDLNQTRLHYYQNLHYQQNHYTIFRLL